MEFRIKKYFESSTLFKPSKYDKTIPESLLNI